LTEIILHLKIKTDNITFLN